jgi:hypothetical protein
MPNGNDPKKPPPPPPPTSPTGPGKIKPDDGSNLPPQPNVKRAATH